MPFILRTMLIALRVRKTVLVVTVILFIIGSATIAYVLEPDTFGTWFNALYWVLTTMATVGYGDYYAQSVVGKVLSIFIYIFGIGLLSLVIGKIIEAFASIHKQREHGQLNFHGSHHIVIINWSKKAQYAVEEILSDPDPPDIVLIDESEKHPLSKVHHVHFISGDPSLASILEKAGICRARAAIIFADTRIDEPALADGKTLLIASSIERIHPEIHTTVEITLDKHIPNFRHANVNEFVLSHDAISRLAVRAALQHGSSEILKQLISRDYGDDIYEIPVQTAWKTYRDAYLGILDLGATLISDRGDMGINRKLDQLIPADARLFVVADEETYQSLQSLQSGS